MEWLTILLSAVGGGGITTVIVALINKKKTPYDMLMEMLSEQKKFYESKNAEFENEKTESAHKSYIIAQTRLCKAKRENPEITCPVDAANDERLRAKCNDCQKFKEK